MQTRYRAAATALLMTATAGMAATGGAAQASGTHHAGAGAAKTLTITIKSKAGAVKLSDDKIRPGNTTFKVKNIDGKASKGLVQVFRLKDGYTLPDAFADFDDAFGSSDPAVVVPAIKRIDKNIVFYGGMPAKGDPSKVHKWAVKIDKVSTYYVANLDQNTLTTFKAKGDKQKRALPDQDGKLNAATGPHGVGNVWKPGKNNASSGWMSTTNNAEEPHFVVLDHVKKSSTIKQVNDCFAGTGPCNFGAKDGASVDTGVISPGHTFLWSYHLPKGKYLAQCFWPSKETGEPHAFMGMVAFIQLG
jgi:hypothetical protein